MYAHLVMFNLGPDSRSTAEAIADQSFPAYKTQKVFKGVTFLGDQEKGNYGSLSLWETKEDAEAWIESAGPQFQKAIAGIVKSPPERHLFEIYEPKP